MAVISNMLFCDFEQRYPAKARKISSSKTYKKKECIMCGTLFVTTYSQKKTCSIACSYENKLTSVRNARIKRLEVQQ